MKTKYDLAVWHNSEEPSTSAFPIGAKDAWGDEIFPLLDERTWTYKGTMPRGCPVTDIKRLEGNKVQCKLGGTTVFTADWAIES